MIPVEDLYDLIGITYKNRREFCEAIGDKYKTGGRNISLQLEYWKKIFVFKKEDRQYTILSICNEEISFFEKANYQDLLEILLIDMIIYRLKTGTDKIVLEITQGQILESVKIVNNSFRKYVGKEKKLAKELNVSIESVEDFYNTFINNYRKKIPSALDRLKSKSMIFWDTQMSVIDVNNQKLRGYDYARICSIILKHQKELMTEMNITNLSQVFILYKQNANEKFYKKVILRVNEELAKKNIDVQVKYYYQEYKIICNELSKLESHLDELLCGFPRDFICKILIDVNERTQQNIMTNANDRREKMIIMWKKPRFIPNDVQCNRVQTEYLDEIKVIRDKVINIT